MLADDLIADSNLATRLPGHAELVRDLRVAHRFVLDEKFASATSELASKRATAIAKVLPLCRAPFESCWFEVAEDHRPGLPRMPIQGRVNPKRVGVLIRSDRRYPWAWRAHLAWSLTRTQSDDRFRCDVSKISMLFEDGSILLDGYGQQQAAAILAGLGIGESDPVRSVNITLGGRSWNDYAEKQAAEHLLGRIGLTASQYHNGVEINARENRRDLKDWDSEPTFWLAAIALLNSRNAVEVVPPVDLSRLNHARIRRGAHPLLSHSTCRIAPKIRERIRAERAIGQNETEASRAHFVRGHFKARSTGVFWWTPFVRGDLRRGLVTKDYALAEAPLVAAE